jgi:hypothetical protein
MKPTKLSIYFDMSDPTDVEKLLSINAILAGAPATDPALYFGSIKEPTAKELTENPAAKEPTREPIEKPAAKEPAKEPAKERELDFPIVVNYQQVTQDLTAAIVSAVGADNPKSAANGAIIGTELKRLGFQKVSQMPDELKPALLEFIVRSTK